MRSLIFVFLSTFISQQLSARAIDATLYPRASAKYRLLQETRADSRSNERASYGLAYNHPVYERFSVQTSLFYQPDNRKLPRLLKINNDWISLYNGINWSYPALFRWFIETGFALQYEISRTDFKEKSREHTRSAVIPYLTFGADYSITKEIELQLEFGLQQRNYALSYDWFWGLGISYQFIRANLAPINEKPTR